MSTWQRRTVLTAALVLATCAGVMSAPAASIVLVLLVSVLIVTVRFAVSRIEIWSPLLASLVLAASAVLVGNDVLTGVLSALLVVGASIPGLLWRRESQRSHTRLVQLDGILAQAERGEAGAAASAASQLAELSAALRTVAHRVSARQVRVWDVDADAGVVTVRAAAHGTGGLTVSLAGNPLRWVWDQDVRMRIDPAPHWAVPGTIPVAERLQRTDTQGVLITFEIDPATIPSDAVLSEAAMHVRGVVALHHERLSAAARERRNRILLDRLTSLPSTLDLDALAIELCRTAMDMTDATGAALGRWDGTAGRVIAVTGTDGGPVPGVEFRARDSELGLAARAGDMLVREATTWSLGRTHIANADERWLRRPRSLAVMPLRSYNGGTSGVIAVWSSQFGAFDPEALELLRPLAPFAARNVEHAHEFRAIKATADRDPLTELHNRRAFDALFEAEAGRFVRHGRPLALLVIDLDHFKSINDRFGHEAGDEVLRRTARILDASIRDIDTAARFGGEEFVVLLPETGMRGALDVAERIRTAIAQAEIHFDGRIISATASIGVSACPERVAAPSALLGSADRALYRAKEDGRNRVVPAFG